MPATIPQPQAAGIVRAKSFGRPRQSWATKSIGSLVQWSTDATMGNWLRRNGGVPVEIAERHDNWSRLGLSQAGPATCRQVEIPENIRLVLLVSDGISDQVDAQTMETLCRRHEADPRALADALVAAANEDADGYRDDATVIAMLRLAP